MSNAELFCAVQRWAAENYPGLVRRMRIAVELQDGSKTSLCVPATPVEPPRPEFKPNEVQEAILEALDGKALKTSDLAKETGWESPTIFRRKGGIKELQAEHLVLHDERLGFYRPDAPPRDLG